MMSHNAVNDSGERENVELSRRGFFGRFALGAVFSIAMPGLVEAASTAAKEERKKRQAKSARTAVRLPKYKSTKAGTSAGSKASAKAKAAKASKTVPSRQALAHNAVTGRPQAHSARVRDIYTGKKHGGKAVLHHAGHEPNREERTSSIIRPVHRDNAASPQHAAHLADRGRLTSHRSLVFQNTHTGEKLNLTYFEQGRYLNDALDEVSHLLRDHRTGDIHPIDPELLDQLHDLKNMLGLNQAFAVICGYRSPLTNAKLHAEHRGVANNSFHMYGRAIDIRVERFDLRRIHNAAIAMHRGGVGYYPESNFIHLDTGTFRTWSL